MKIHFAFILCLLLLSCSPKKSEVEKKDSTIKIDLKTVYDSPGRGTMILYPMSVMADSMRSKITFPDLTGISDTTYASVFFTGKNNGGMDKGILVLVGNYASKEPLIWVDYNNDLSFSDAKKPIRFSGEFVTISIPNTDRPELTHDIRLHKTEPVRKAQIKQMLDQFITKGQTYSDFFMDERRNIHVGDFVYKGDSIRVGLMDWNVNGKYTDIAEDRLVAGTYGGSITGTEESEGAVIIDSIIYFQAGKYAFQVVKMSDNGRTMEIRPVLADKIKQHIKVGEPLPDYTLELMDGKTSTKKLLDGHKYLYLSFWATWCSGCRQEIDDLKKLYSGYSDKVALVSLNYNEDDKKIKLFLEKNSISWPNGIASQEIINDLLIRGLPRNILIDSTGKIVEMNMHPSELLKRLGER